MAKHRLTILSTTRVYRDGNAYVFYRHGDQIASGIIQKQENKQ